MDMIISREILPAPKTYSAMLVITALTADATNIPKTVVSADMSDITCSTGTILTATVELQLMTGDLIPLTASFRMPVQARDGREMVALAKFVDGIASISIPFAQSGVWQITEQTINSALPPEAQMSFIGLTVYVVV